MGEHCPCCLGYKVDVYPVQPCPGLPDIELAYRCELWAEHGHQVIFGDDGEMQCALCIPLGAGDYKRDPLERVEAAAFQGRMLRAASQANHADEVARLQAEVARIKEKNDITEEAADRNVERILASMAGMEDQMVSVATAKTLYAEITRLEAEVARLTAELDDLKRELAAWQAAAVA